MDLNPEIPKNRDITYFGKTNFRSTNTVFGIKRKDRRQHMYILGKSGTGKSVLLSNLIAQNIENGEGVCVVDPHGELVEEILNLIPEHRAKDVIYFNPADTDFHVGFNVIALEDPKYKHLVASGLMGIFTKIWANAWSSRMEYILNNAILALLDTPGTTLLGIPRLLVDKDYSQMIISNLKDPVVKAFWVHEYEQWREQFRNEAIAPIQNKVGQFLSTSIIRNVVGQSKSTIDIFNIMNEGKIFLVNVSKGRVGEDNSALLGGMIITKIQLAAMERVRIPENERKDFYLYVDEFQNFATDSFANILSEARKYRLNLIVAHQYTAQLSNENGTAVRDAVFGNVGTMIIFRVGADDADFIEKEFEPEFTAQDLVNLPNFHVYLKLMIDGVTSRPFSATTLPPIKFDISAGVKEKIIASSRALYTRPREEVENEINRWSGMLQVGDGEAKYKADCSNCGKVTMVPFEPKEGRPVYCKECMFKIKSGEIKAGTGFVATRSGRQEEKNSTAPLAALGIEFKDSTAKVLDVRKYTPTSFNNKNHTAPKINNNHTNNIHKPIDKKHSGPSPLLKGLLQTIGINNSAPEKKDTTKETLVKVPTPAPVSLSTLKKPDMVTKVHSPMPTKEASEENKASLKDLLVKVTTLHKAEQIPEVKISSVPAPISTLTEKIAEPAPVVEVIEKPTIKENIVVQKVPISTPPIPEIVD
ncbi:type IV secretion system DNA-binding domain-containing protein, partial [Candidatus Nomurabacteria bacterium]|nr:type IV secretion system DNA-binding domain-containing protein [Candidatus Nomurabacteria bacterium]